MLDTSTIATTIKLTLETPPTYTKFQNIHAILVRITDPCIFIIGCIGLITNTSTIVLLSKSFVTKNLRHKWTLIALAVSDLLLNIALLIRVLHDLIGGKMMYLCITISFLSHLAELLSACFTVLFTIQRYAAVRYPFQAAFQKRSSPIIPLLLIIVFGIIFSSVLSRARINSYTDCHEELKLKWFIADALLSFIIPFSLILIFNVLIVNLIRKHGRSSITVQSTLSRNDKCDNNRRHHDSNKNNPHEESCSITCSPTSQGTISEMDIDKKLNLTNSLITNDENNTSMKKKKSILSYNSSDETEVLANETYIPMTPIAITNSDASSIDHPQSSQPSTKSHRGGKKKKHNRLSNSYESEELACLSNDVDSMSAKEGQTTQSIRVTRMLVLVSTCFLILNAPAHICLIAAKIYTNTNSTVYNKHTELDNFQQITNLTNNQIENYVFIQPKNDTILDKKNSSSQDERTIDDPISIHLLYMAIFFTQSISYASYSINFFLYSFSGVAFRTSFRQFFSKLRRH